jgi:hypothetical protein
MHLACFLGPYRIGFDCAKKPLRRYYMHKLVAYSMSLIQQKTYRSIVALNKFRINQKKQEGRKKGCRSSLFYTAKVSSKFLRLPCQLRALSYYFAYRAWP